MLRNDLRVVRVRFLMALVAIVTMALALAPRSAAAGFFDFLFGDSSPPSRTASKSGGFFNPFADPDAPTPVATGGRRVAYCVRSCDGKYFPLTPRSGASSAQMCQSFCPASPTKVFSGASIDNSVADNGQRYTEMPNAFAYRKALKADCTCNGRSPAGLAPVDLSLDTTLRPGDIVATANGLVAYSGVKAGNSQSAEFTPVAEYPGLTAELRARLGEMKVMPVSADIVDDGASDITGSLSESGFTQAAMAAPKGRGPASKRAAVD